MQEKVDPVLSACDSGGDSCFAAGTKLRTPAGYRPIEDISAGDLILSRSEANPGGFVEEKAVEEVFVRFDEVLHLHVGGQTIRTTTKHPFYVCNQGWTPVNELEIGQWILSEAGDWKAVEEIYATGEWEIVYNLRIEEHHTYFVGDEGWGWSLWAHNACEKPYYIYEDLVNGGWAVFEKGGNGKPFNDPEIGTISGPDEASVKAKIPVKKPSSKGKVNVDTVMKDALNTSFGEWLGRNKRSDILSQKQNTNHIEEWPPTNAPTHAHHIVMKKGSGVAVGYARESQKILQEVGIDPIFGTENLVWAPNYPSHRNGTGISPKEGASGKGYAKSVLDRLKFVYKGSPLDKGVIEAELKDIAKDYIQEI